MPSHLKALIVILVLGALVYAFAKPAACSMATTAEDFARRRNLWFAITLTAFLSHNFWIFVALSGLLLLVAARMEPNKPAMFLSLLFAAPMISDQISGLGVINHFFTINYARLLALSVLLPAYLYLRKQADVEPFGRLLCDKVLIAYLGLQLVLMLSANTLTNTLRHCVFYAFIDVVLPYYVASRGVRSLQHIRDLLMSFAVAAMVVAAIAVFEFLFHWLLYAALDDALGLPWSYGRYLERGAGALRAQASTGQPIPLGFVMAVAIGVMLYLKRLVPNAAYWWLGMALLLAGLIASISRGPWIGAAAILLIFIGVGAAAARRTIALGLVTVAVAGALFASPLGDAMARYLPFVGTVDAETITYRQRLFEIAISVISDNPFFGISGYVYAERFQELKQGGAGFIDLVNTYLGIALASGLIGLGLFSGFFALVATGIFRSMRTLPDRSDELHVLGQALFATLMGILIIIFTTSSISVIPLIYWSVAGLGIAYVRSLARAGAPAVVQNVAAAPGARAVPLQHHTRHRPVT
jgi:O-antigen ligase